MTASGDEPGWARPTDPWGRPLPDQPPLPPDLPSGPPAPGPDTGGGPTPGSADKPDSDYPPADWWGSSGSGDADQPAFPPDDPGLVPQRTPPAAIWALVSSLAGFAICGIVLGPLGIFLGFRARNRIQQTGGPGSGLATAAIVLGIVAVVLNIVVLAVVLSDPDILNDPDGMLQ